MKTPQRSNTSSARPALRHSCSTCSSHRLVSDEFPNLKEEDKEEPDLTDLFKLVTSMIKEPNQHIVDLVKAVMDTLPSQNAAITMALKKNKDALMEMDFGSYLRTKQGMSSGEKREFLDMALQPILKGSNFTRQGLSNFIIGIICIVSEEKNEDQRSLPFCALPCHCCFANWRWRFFLRMSWDSFRTLSSLTEETTSTN